MDETIFHLLKKALWEFFCDCLRKNPSNPKDENYRKNLTTKEEKIIRAAKAKMPNLREILLSAIDSVQREIPNMLWAEYIEQNFSECVTTLERKAFNIYLKNEENLFLSIIEEWILQEEELIEEINRKFTRPLDFAKEVCRYFYPMVQRMEFDSSQTRKARGGKTLEHIVEYLLKMIGIPCQKPSKDARKKLKRVDLVIPDQETAIKRPDNAFFLSCKRTLRERWKQAIPEQKPSWRVFLLTIDENLPQNKAEEIDSLGMIVYVRDELKDQPHLQKKDWVRRLSELPKDIKGGIH